MTGYEISDRYGGNYPDAGSICRGKCEGMGCFPVYMGVNIDAMYLSPSSVSPAKDESDEVLIALWMKAEKEKISQDGYHIVKCPECRGSGKAEKLDD